MNNRVFKFRAWDSKKKNWMEFVPPKEYMIDADEWDRRDAGDDGGEACLFFPQYPRLNRTFNDRIIYTQFTGLKDKFGKEIYEGDILEYGADIHTGTICDVLIPNRAVEWDEKIQGFGLNKDSLASMYEVIGNIFEHKHLLDI